MLVLQNLPKLLFFDARCNRIEVFPEGVLQCNDLIEVNLSRNKVDLHCCFLETFYFIYVNSLFNISFAIALLQRSR